MEDESRSIGQVRLPDVFYARMQQAPVHVLLGDTEGRVQRLVQDYGALPTEQLEQAIQRIAKRLGPQHAKQAIDALHAGDLEVVARVALVYYDKAYDRCLARRKGGIHQVVMGATTAHELARMPLN